MLAWGVHTFWFHSLPRAELQVAGQSLHVIVADRPRSLSWGLMFRHDLPAGEGMLFVYPARQRVCMWMSNTFIPLSVAFLSEDGVIVDMDDMVPMSRESHCAPTPVRYALEVPRGWFAAQAVAVGGQVSGLPRSPRN